MERHFERRVSSSSGDGDDDVTCRPLYAELESEAGEDSVYVSVHSNAGGGSGTETYMYLDGTQGLSFRWEKVAGPAGDRIEAPDGWERGPAGIGDGDGDGDDATVLADMRGAYASVYLVREFIVPSLAGLENLSLRVAYDDGFAAYLNGVEAARQNLGAGAAHLDLAASAIEPTEEVIDLAPLIASLRAGRYVLALQVHNASLDSSDLSLAAELAGEFSNRRER